MVVTMVNGSSADSLLLTPASWLDNHAAEGGAKIRGLRAGKPGAPGVVLVHEWWGISDMLKEHAATLAKDYSVFVPNFHYDSGMHPAHESVTAMLGSHDFTQKGYWMAMAHGITEDFLPGVNATITAARLEGSKMVAVVGFCLGGAVAISALARLDGAVSAAVSFSGVPFKLPSTPLDRPFQGHFGAASKASGFSDSTATAALRAACPPSSKDHEVFVYDGAGHGFLNNHEKHAADRRKMGLGGEEAKEAAAAKQAWARALEFLDRHMRPKKAG